MLQDLTYSSVDDDSDKDVTIAKNPPSSNSGFYDALMLPRKINNLVRGSIMTSEFQKVKFKDPSFQKEEEDETKENKLGFNDVIPIILFGILLPTTDVYSDIGFIAFLFGGNKGYHPIYATIMICPLALAFVFTLIQWFKFEKHKTWTVPLLLVQFWPQYRQCRLLYWIWKHNEKEYEKEKMITERNVSSIGN